MGSERWLSLRGAPFIRPELRWGGGGAKFRVVRIIPYLPDPLQLSIGAVIIRIGFPGSIIL